MIEHRAILITETLSDIHYSSLDIKLVFKKEDVIQINKPHNYASFTYSIISRIIV